MITDRIDSVTKIKTLKAHQPAPTSVKIELTGRCNFRCSFCARSDLLRKQEDMNWQMYVRLVNEMRDAGVKELGMFYLGESMMYPKLADAIRLAKDIGFEYVFLTTNASLATPKKVEECMDAGLDSLKWSFNYSGPEQLHDIAGVKPKIWNVMLENIEDAFYIREASYSCGLYASYIEYDGEQGEKMVKALELVTPFVDEVYALPLYNQASLVTEKEREKGWEASPGNRGRAGMLRDPLPCWAVFQGHITSGGLLSACCFDHNEALTMADLKDVSFMEGWNSPAFQSLRAAHINKDVKGTACEHCVLI